MRKLATLFLAIAATTATANPPEPKDATPEATRAYLLDAAAADFREHTPGALAFREVYFGQFDAKGKSPQYEICGEYQVEQDGKKEWRHFVTLKTSGYEQYLADEPLSYCTRDGMSWDEDDWSAELLKRYRQGVEK